MPGNHRVQTVLRRHPGERCNCANLRDKRKNTCLGKCVTRARRRLGRDQCENRVKRFCLLLLKGQTRFTLFNALPCLHEGQTNRSTLQCETRRTPFFSTSFQRLSKVQTSESLVSSLVSRARLGSHSLPPSVFAQAPDKQVRTVGRD